MVGYVRQKIKVRSCQANQVSQVRLGTLFEETNLILFPSQTTTAIQSVPFATGLASRIRTDSSTTSTITTQQAIKTYRKMSIKTHRKTATKISTKTRRKTSIKTRRKMSIKIRRKSKEEEVRSSFRIEIRLRFRFRIRRCRRLRPALLLSNSNLGRAVSRKKELAEKNLNKIK